MDRTEDATGQQNGESIESVDPTIASRARELVSRMETPKSPHLNPAFRNLSIKERQERLLMVELLAGEYLSAEEITDFLPAFGLKVPLSRVYTYLAQVRLPKNYRKHVEKRSRRVHDGLAVYHLIRIARDARLLGFTVERVQVSRRLSDSNVIPDAYWFICTPKSNGFFLEEQIAPLPDTRWRDKLRAYLKRRLETKDAIRVLFVVNDRSDLVRARGYARELLKEHGCEAMQLFLFAEQIALRGSGNVCGDRTRGKLPMWQTAWGDAVALTDWMRRPAGGGSVGGPPGRKP